MNWPPNGPSDTPLGAQRPSVLSVPPFVSSAGQEAIELAALAGLHLDPWQQFVIHNALGERPDGTWAAFEVAAEVARQNGKGGLLETRSLAGLFLLGERLITHTAHEFPTALEAFIRLLALIENTPELSRRVRKVSRSHGEEGIILKSGQRILFRTRTKRGGLGFTGDVMLFDEAMELAEAALGALMPTLAARPNPQIWYTGTVVDQTIHEYGRAFARVRQRALRGGDPRLAYFGWEPRDSEGKLLELEKVAAFADDRDIWAQANPGLGIRISPEYIADERRALDLRTFAVQRLSVGDWPDLDVSDEQVLSKDAWEDLEDEHSTIVGRVGFAYDVTPDGRRAAIGTAGYRPDRKWHVELVEHRNGTDWVGPRLKELVARHDAPLPVKCDDKGPAGALLPDLRELDIEVEPVTATEYAQACGGFVGKAEQDALRHLGQPELETAVVGARKRSLGDAWAWDRKNSSVDISPLVAVTLALWGMRNAPPPPPPLDRSAYRFDFGDEDVE